MLGRNNADGSLNLMAVCRLQFKPMLYRSVRRTSFPFCCLCVDTVNFQLLDSQNRVQLHGNGVKIEHVFGLRHHTFRNVSEIYLKYSKDERNFCNIYFMAR